MLDSLAGRDITWVRRWLLTVLVFTIALMQVGAITRLTESGLSITEWRPLGGSFPPLSAAEWERVFALYRETSQYRLANVGMSLAEFQTIFWWEYGHRLLGRILGLVVIIPYIVFLVRRMLPNALGWGMAGLIVLGSMQGVIGWWMVQSGFAERIEVSHIRLAIHLLLAMAVVGGLVIMLRLTRPTPALVSDLGRRQRPPAPLLLAIGVFALVVVQIVLGAFVAGTNAGLVYNDWPLYGGAWWPENYLKAQPDSFGDALHHSLLFLPEAMQANHRTLAYALLGIGGYLAWRHRLGGVFLSVCGVQSLIGIITLVLSVPVAWGALHQLGAIFLFIVTLSMLVDSIYGR